MRALGLRDDTDIDVFREQIWGAYYWRLLSKSTTFRRRSA